MDIIRNPNRGKKVLEPYIPEYKRRGLEPIPAGALPDFSPSVNGETIDDFGDVFEEPQVLDETSSSSLTIGQFVLMIKGSVVLHGTEEEVISEIKNRLYDESKTTSIDDIIVLKQVSIKVGVFLE